MRAAVIGGAGRMGVWFARHLMSIGYEVTVSDIDARCAEQAAKLLGASWEQNNIKAARGAELVIVSVPVRAIGGVIREVAPKMVAGQILLEISSFKVPHFRYLQESSQTGVVPVSVHPMFGPSALGLEGLTVAVVPVVDPEKEMKLAGKLFEGADLVQISSTEHDEAMANILSLTYMMNLAFAATVKKGGLETIRRLAGTSFMVQLGLSSSIVGEDVGLIETLLHANPYAERVYSIFTECFSQLKGMDKEKIGEYIDDLRASNGIRDDYVAVNRWRHQSYEGYKKIMGPTSLPEGKSRVSSRSEHSSPV